MKLLERVLTLTDSLRLAEESGERAGWYKEWFHFCVLGPEIRAVINFSLISDRRPAALPGARQARVTVLVEQGGAWDGDLYEIQPRDVHLSPGRIDLRFGHNCLRFQDGAFYVSAALESRPLTVDLHIRPQTYPLLRSRASIGPGSIDWLVVPRLQTSGTLVVDRRVYRLQDAPTYHDHNWGSWLWGQDFAWQWGFALPTERSAQWSLVFESMTDRARNQEQQLKLCLWKGEKLARIFAYGDIISRPDGYLPLRRVPKFPRIMALIAPEWTTDVPQAFEIEATAGQDHLHCRFQAQDVAQIVVPNETDLGETIINEVVGKFQAEGRVKGEEVTFAGEGFFEFLT
jgi:hypothetical protein